MENREKLKIDVMLLIATILAASISDEEVMVSAGEAIKRLKEINDKLGIKGEEEEKKR